MPSSGEIIFSKDRPPQSFIFCGRCDEHFIMCGCTGVGHAIDYIFKGLPPPPPDLTPLERLRRFASLVVISPSMGRFAAVEWHRYEGRAIVASLGACKTQLTQMMEDYVAQLPSDPLLTGLAKGVGDRYLNEQPASVQVEAIGKEGRAAMDTFLAGDWSTVTRVGIMLIQNAFQASDPERYRLDDPHLLTLFQKGVGCLQMILNMGYSDTHGWRLALECDRPPQGTDELLETATERDYFLQYVNKNLVQVSARAST